MRESRVGADIPTDSATRSRAFPFKGSENFSDPFDPPARPASDKRSLAALLELRKRIATGNSGAGSPNFHGRRGPRDALNEKLYAGNVRQNGLTMKFVVTIDAPDEAGAQQTVERLIASAAAGGLTLGRGTASNALTLSRDVAPTAETQQQWDAQDRALKDREIARAAK